MYHATKWGIEGFAESLAQELAPTPLVQTGTSALGGIPPSRGDR